MELKSTYQKMITAMQGGWGAMSGALGMTVAALENHVYEKKGQAMSVHLATQMQDISQTTFFAEAIAKDAGGTFVKLPDVDHIDNDSLLAKFNELYAEIGELSAEFSEDTKGGEIDDRARARLEADGAKIHRTVQELLALTFRIYCRDGKAGTSK